MVEVREGALEGRTCRRGSWQWPGLEFKRGGRGLSDCSMPSAHGKLPVETGGRRVPDTPWLSCVRTWQCCGRLEFQNTSPVRLTGSPCPFTCLRLRMPGLFAVPATLGRAASVFHPTFPLFYLSGLDMPGEETTILIRKSRLLLILRFTSDNFSIILWTRMLSPLVPAQCRWLTHLAVPSLKLTGRLSSFVHVYLPPPSPVITMQKYTPAH